VSVLHRWVRYDKGKFVLSWQEQHGKQVFIKHRPMTTLERLGWQVAQRVPKP
jgi:hypothetical protein